MATTPHRIQCLKEYWLEKLPYSGHVFPHFSALHVNSKEQIKKVRE